MRDSTSTRYLTGKSLIVLLMLGFCLLQFLPAASSGTDRSAVRPALSDRAHPAAKWSGALLLDAERQGDSNLVVGDHGLILRSSNGGKDFVQVESPTRRMLTSVAIDGEVALAVGHDTTVLRSLDGGSNWGVVHVDPEADLALFSVCIVDSKRMVAVGSFGTLLISEDGGDEWRQELISDEGPHVYSVQKSPTRLVATGEFGSIFESRDQGDSWSQLDSPYEGTFFHILTTDSESLIVMGLRGNLWVGQPGGWKQVNIASDSSLFGGTRIGDRYLVVGDEGRVLLRLETGSWTDASPSERRIVSAVLEKSDGTLLLIGEKGIREIDPPASTSKESRQEGGK